MILERGLSPAQRQSFPDAIPDHVSVRVKDGGIEVRGELKSNGTGVQRTGTSNGNGSLPLGAQIEIASEAAFRSCAVEMLGSASRGPGKATILQRPPGSQSFAGFRARDDRHTKLWRNGNAGCTRIPSGVR